MYCTRCGLQVMEGAAYCAHCGMKVAGLDMRMTADPEGDEGPQPGRSALEKIFFGKEDQVKGFDFLGRIVVLLLFAAWGISFLTEPMGSRNILCSFMHNVNLVFHMAGYVIVNPFGGELLGRFGGTLMQFLIPLSVTLAFLYKENPFGSTVGIWWMGQSLMDVAPYIADARAMNLTLLGGYTGKEVPYAHAWHMILKQLGLLRFDHAIAWMAHIMGIVLIVVAMAWGVTVLVHQSRRIDW